MKRKRAKKIKQNVIAIVYDFDGTLTPGSMQNYTVLDVLGIDNPNKFWAEVEQESIKKSEEKDLVWMRKIKDLAAKKEDFALKKEIFKLRAKRIKYYKGIPLFFRRIQSYVKSKSKRKMKVSHYIVSSGLREILEGISIGNYFDNIFGSEYHYDQYGKPDFPKVVITDTVKTQYIFRINKGKEKIGESINKYMPEKKRPIPFKNIIYIGDGLSDVPAMNVTKKNGGYAIAVYDPNIRKETGKKGKKTCTLLLKANRVDFIAAADYRLKLDLDTYVKLILDTIIHRYLLESKKLTQKATGKKKKKKKKR